MVDVVKIPTLLPSLAPYDREVISAVGAAQFWGNHRQGENTPRVLASCMAHPNYWSAGRTNDRPQAGATAEANEYETGPEPGHAWPYMSPGAIMKHSANNWYWPECRSGVGVNHYQRAIPVRKGMLGRIGSRINIVLTGLLSGVGSNNYKVEVAVRPNLILDYASGIGGHNGTGLLQAGGANWAYFRSPAFTSSIGANQLFFCEINGLTVRSAYTFWWARFYCGSPTDSGAAPHFDQTSSQLSIWGNAVSWDRNDQNLAFLYCIRSDRTGGSYAAPGQCYDAPFGGSGTNVATEPQDGTEATFDGNGFHAILFPGAA